MSSTSTTNPLVPVSLRLGSTAVSGFSRSGIATWLEVPEYSALFDVGVCPLGALSMDHVFVSHGHPDHASGVLRLASLRAMVHEGAPATVFLPESLVSKFERLSAVLSEVEGGDPHVSAPPRLVGLMPGQRVELPSRSGMSVEAFPVPHRVESLGYTLRANRRKLKAEFADLPGAEVGALRRKGVVVQEEVLEPVFTYLGDHTGEVFDLQSHIWNSSVLVVETTFIRPGEEAAARERGHTHLSELVSALERHGDQSRVQHVLLKHFSMKYSEAEIRETVNRSIPERFRDRVQVLID
jgi:ribonuclease Z